MGQAERGMVFTKERFKYEYEALDRLDETGLTVRGRPEKADGSIWDCCIVGPQRVGANLLWRDDPNHEGHQLRQRTHHNYEDGTSYKEWVGSPYEDQLLRLKLVFPQAFPKYPPRAYFVQEVFHPSVGHDGLIGLTILDGPQVLSESVTRKTVAGRNLGTWGMGMDWTENTTVAKILITIQSMLGDPTDKDHDCVILNEEAMHLAHTDRDAFDDKVREHFREAKEYVRACKAAPLTPAAAAARKNGDGFTIEGSSPQIEALKKKYGVYDEKKRQDRNSDEKYNDEDFHKRYEEKMHRNHV